MCRSMVDIRSTAAEIRRGKKEEEEEEGKKLQGKNIYGLPITYGDHNKPQHENIYGLPIT